MSSSITQNTPSSHDTTSNLCIHCTLNPQEPTSLTLCPHNPYGQITTMCHYFSKKPFPYCPKCGHIFTLADNILDDDTDADYLTVDAIPIGYNCINCNEITIM